MEVASTDWSMVLSSGEFWGQVLTAIAAIITFLWGQRRNDRRYSEDRLRERLPLISLQSDLYSDFDKSIESRLVGDEVIPLESNAKVNEFNLLSDASKITFNFRIRNDSPFEVKIHSIGFAYYHRNWLGLCWLPRKRAFRIGETSLFKDEESSTLKSHQVCVYGFKYLWFLTDARVASNIQAKTPSITFGVTKRGNHWSTASIPSKLSRRDMKNLIAHRVRARPFVRLTDGSYHYNGDIVFRHPPAQKVVHSTNWFKKTFVRKNRINRRIYVERRKALWVIPFFYVCD